MREILTFFKDIFLSKNNDNMKIGLTQFKPKVPIEKTQKNSKSVNEVKLSDLMRRSC